MPDLPETVTLTTTEYLRLLESDLTLERLNRAGVDNWEGYSYIEWAEVNDALAGAKAALSRTA